MASHDRFLADPRPGHGTQAGGRPALAIGSGALTVLIGVLVLVWRRASIVVTGLAVRDPRTPTVAVLTRRDGWAHRTCLQRAFTYGRGRSWLPETHPYSRLSSRSMASH
jgi:hypothetical protein